jgi:hypothetical protein
MADEPILDAPPPVEPVKPKDALEECSLACAFPAILPHEKAIEPKE